MFTFRDLLNKLQTFNDEQLDTLVFLYNEEEDLFYDEGVIDLRTAQREIPGFISKDIPYIVF